MPIDRAWKKYGSTCWGGRKGFGRQVPGEKIRDDKAGMFSVASGYSM